MSRIDEVVVIGAGVAGLACARSLLDAGLPVVVLEATPVIGGRVRSVTTTSGAVWELGAQVLHGTVNPARALLGPNAADRSFRDNDFRVLVDRDPVPLATLARRGIAPWALAGALGGFDAPTGRATSVGRWLHEATGGGTAGSVGSAWLQAEWAARPDQLDVGELGRWVQARGAASAETVVAGGLIQVPERLAAGLTVHTDMPVRRLELVPGGVRVCTAHHELVAPVVVVTVPPWVVRAGELRIADVRDDRPLALSTLHGGDAVVAVVETDGSAPTSQTVLDAATPTGFLRCVAGSADVQLVAKGAGAARLREVLAHRDALTDLLATALPWTEGVALGRVVRADWGSERYQRGAFSTPTAGGAKARLAWRTPIGRRIFFAGEATCDPDGLARVQGALDSGRTAAGQICETLAGTNVA